jgi:hypothetical protein
MILTSAVFLAWDRRDLILYIETLITFLPQVLVFYGEARVVFDAYTKYRSSKVQSSAE